MSKRYHAPQSPPQWLDATYDGPTHYQDRRRRNRPQLQPIRAKLALAYEGPHFQSEAMQRLLECLEAGATHGLGTLAHAAETLGIVAILPQHAHEPVPASIDTLANLSDVPEGDMAYYWRVLERDGETEQCRVLLHKAYTAVCTLPRARDASDILAHMAHVHRAGARVHFAYSAGNWSQWVMHSLAWLAVQCVARFSDVSVDVDALGNAPALPYMDYDAALAKQERKERAAWHAVYASSPERLPRKLYKEHKHLEEEYSDSLSRPAAYSAIAGTSGNGRAYVTRRHK